MEREEQEVQVQEVLERIETLATVLARGVRNDERLRQWAGWVEMTAREYKAVPLAGSAACFVATVDGGV